MEKNQEKGVLLIGSGKALFDAIDILQSNEVVLLGVLSKYAEEQDMFNEVPFLGDWEQEEYTQLLRQQARGIVAVEQLQERRELAGFLQKSSKKEARFAIHKKAVVSPSCKIMPGVLVGPFTYLENETSIGKYTKIGPSAVVEQGAQLADFCSVGAGAVIGSQARIAEGALIGSRVYIAPKVKIGAGAQVAAGSVVLQEVEKEAMIFGNPAKAVN